MISRMKRAFFEIKNEDCKMIKNDPKLDLYEFKIGDHIVIINKDKITCSCPDMEFRGSENIGSNHLCKHQFKVIFLFHEEMIKIMEKYR